MHASQGESIFSLSLQDLFKMLQRRLWVIALVMVLAVGMTIGIDLNRTPTYQASIKVLVGQPNTYDSLVAENQGVAQIAKTVEQTVATRPVAVAAAQQLPFQMSPEAIRGGLQATLVEDTRFITITYEDSDPERAQLVVNTVGEVLPNEVNRVSSPVNTVTTTVWESAVGPGQYTDPSVRRDAVLALILGAILGLGLAFLLERLNNRWRSLEEVEQTAGAPIYGLIPDFKVTGASGAKKKEER